MPLKLLQLPWAPAEFFSRGGRIKGLDEYFNKLTLGRKSPAVSRDGASVGVWGEVVKIMHKIPLLSVLL